MPGYSQIIGPSNKFILDLIDENKFLQMKDEWNDLLKKSESDNIFLTWEWLYTWWRHFKGNDKLSIFAIRTDDSLVGIVPCYIKSYFYKKIIPVRVLKFLGSEKVGSDYLDFILYHGMEEELLNIIGDYILNGTAWDIIVLDDWKSTSKNLNLLKKVLHSNEIHFYEQVCSVCPYISLPLNIEEYYKTLSSNMRYHIKRRTRGLNKEFKIKFVNLDSIETEEQIKDIFNLHHLRWQDKKNKDTFLNNDVSKFHESIISVFSKNGWIKVYHLRLDGKSAAVLYGFKYNNKMYYYQSGFDPKYARYSIGVVLMAYSVEKSILDKLDEFDFLRGDEAYKRKWTDSVRLSHSIIISRDSLKGNIYIKEKQFKNRLSHILAHLKSSSREINPLKK